MPRAFRSLVLPLKPCFLSKSRTQKLFNCPTSASLYDRNDLQNLKFVYQHTDRCQWNLFCIFQTGQRLKPLNVYFKVVSNLSSKMIGRDDMCEDLRITSPPSDKATPRESQTDSFCKDLARTQVTLEFGNDHWEWYDKVRIVAQSKVTLMESSTDRAWLLGRIFH